MPRRDQTGPAGMGPMTGRGLGPCSGNAQPFYGGFGRGFGRGLGRGGFGFHGRGFMPFYAAPSMENEKDVLEREINYLKSELESLQKRHDAVSGEE